MKHRLTITLSPELLQTVDTLVDRKNIRNRSHAIEHLIRQSIGKNITTAVLLAGGVKVGNENTLLKPVQGIPLLERQVSHLLRNGITRCVLCLDKNDTKIEERYQDGKSLGINLEYSYEAKNLGTAGAIKQAERFLENEVAFVVMHGDVLSNIELDEVMKFHQDEAAEATLVVKPKLGEKELGQVYMKGSRVTSFSKTAVEREMSIINTGIYVLSTNILKTISSKKPSFLETDVFPVLAQENKLSAFIFQGIWYDISTNDQYLEAEKQWSVA
jgi:mannose-1-phosphate guanylyltransferase